MGCLIIFGCSYNDNEQPFYSLNLFPKTAQKVSIVAVQHINFFDVLPTLFLLYILMKM